MAEGLCLAEDGCGHGQPIGDGFARAGLGGDDDVAAHSLRRQNGGLDGGRIDVIALGEGAGQRGAGFKKGHEGDFT